MRCLACALIVCTWVGAAVAQQSAGDVYVTGGVSFPRQAALEASSPPPFPAPGGSTVGWLAGGGVFLPKQFSLDVEVSRTGTMHSSHLGRHDTRQVATRRDWFLSLGMKKHFAPSPGFCVEPIAGIVWVGDEGTYEAALGSSAYRGYYPLAWVPGVMFGSDFRIGGSRIAITPGVRFAFTGVPTGQDCVISSLSGQPDCFEDAERWEFLHPRWTTRPSVALRVDF